MDINVPEVGESIHEAVITIWHKKDGDTVAIDDLICELETDKISLELFAEAAGTFSIKAQVNETVKIGQTIATISTSDVKGTETPKAEIKPKTPLSPTAQTTPPKKTEPPPPQSAPSQDPAQQPDIEPVASSAPRTTVAAPVDDERTTRIPLSPIRKRIAEHLVSAQQQTAMLTTFNEADMSSIIALKDKHQANFLKKHQVKLGFMSFFVKAVVEALRAYPIVNSQLDGDTIIQHNYFNIGVAVGSKKGLVVPVLKDADTMHFADIERNILNYVEKINSNKLTLTDLEGGTFSITNGGVYGSMLSTPILNSPQSGVLGMHAIKDRPVAIDGKIEIRPIMYLALSYDHRIIDGREAVSFLKMIKEYIEQPEEMLLEF